MSAQGDGTPAIGRDGRYVDCIGDCGENGMYCCDGDWDKPPNDPPVTHAEPGGFPPDLHAPFTGGPIIRPKSRPKIVRGDDA